MNNVINGSNLGEALTRWYPLTPKEVDMVSRFFKGYEWAIFLDGAENPYIVIGETLESGVLSTYDDFKVVLDEVFEQMEV